MVKTVILLLGAAMIVGIIGIVILAATTHPIPEVLTTVVVGAVTGMTGILVKADNQTKP